MIGRTNAVVGGGGGTPTAQIFARADTRSGNNMDTTALALVEQDGKYVVSLLDILRCAFSAFDGMLYYRIEHEDPTLAAAYYALHSQLEDGALQSAYYDFERRVEEQGVGALKLQLEVTVK